MQYNPANARASSQPQPVMSIINPNAAKIMISEWKVDTAERQQASVNAIEAAWDKAYWPDTLLSYHVHCSTDGSTLMHYSQWITNDGFDNFAAIYRQQRIALIDAAVPDIKRYGLGSFSLYRSHYLDETMLTGCIVAVQVEASSAVLQKQWIDAVITALQEDEIPGLRAAHFHICDDGKHIINYAEWASEAAHERAMRPGKGISQIDSEAWKKVQTMPGITQQGFKRYALPQQINKHIPADTTVQQGVNHG